MHPSPGAGLGMNGDPKLTSLPYTRTELDNGNSLALCVDDNGDTTIWVIVPGGGDDQGCADCASHENLGRLPREWRLRVGLLICSAPTKSGERCTRDVRNVGERCTAHRDPK